MTKLSAFLFATALLLCSCDIENMKQDIKSSLHKEITIYMPSGEVSCTGYVLPGAEFGYAAGDIMIKSEAGVHKIKCDDGRTFTVNGNFSTRDIP